MFQKVSIACFPLSLLHEMPWAIGVPSHQQNILRNQICKGPPYNNGVAMEQKPTVAQVRKPPCALHCSLLTEALVSLSRCAHSALAQNNGSHPPAESLRMTFLSTVHSIRSLSSLLISCRASY